MMQKAEMTQAAPRGHILVVDDDDFFRESLSRNLSDAGYDAAVYCDGLSACENLPHFSQADLILLDWKMPGMTGIEVLQRLRDEQIDTPVIFLTVLSDQIYEEAGLRSGAVDFIEKSRSFSILLRRIELSIGGQKIVEVDGVPAPSDTYRRGALTLKHNSRRATWHDQPVELTLTEFGIVSYLAENSDRDVSYRDIYDIVHGEGFVAGYGEIGYRANVRAFIKRIRQKFRDVDPNFTQITNYPSFGYRWQDEQG